LFSVLHEAPVFSMGCCYIAIVQKSHIHKHLTIFLHVFDLSLLMFVSTQYKRPELDAKAVNGMLWCV